MEIQIFFEIFFASTMIFKIIYKSYQCFNGVWTLKHNWKQGSPYHVETYYPMPMFSASDRLLPRNLAFCQYLPIQSKLQKRPNSYKQYFLHI